MNARDESKRQLPPDPENMNDNRAEWAHKAIRAFEKASGTDREDALHDLLCDLMHWADRYGMDFARELERARNGYAEETMRSDDMEEEGEPSVCIAGNPTVEGQPCGDPDCVCAPGRAKARMKIDLDRIVEAVKRDDNIGFCIECGAENYGVVPDARGYECESCGALHTVFGAEELLLMVKA